MSRFVLEPSTLEDQPRRKFLDWNDGHTARMKGVVDTEQPYVVCDLDLQHMHSNVYIKPISALDDLVLGNSRKFLDSGKACRRSWLISDDPDKTSVQLTKANTWKSVIDILESNAVSKSVRKTRNMFNDKFEINYTLPVVSDQIVKLYDINTNKKNIASNQNRIRWQGKNYKTNTLYYSSSIHKFHEFGKYKLVDKKALGLSPLYGSIKEKGVDLPRRLTEWCTNTHYDMGYKRDPYNHINHPFTGKLLSIDIDLSVDTQVSHISTMGKRYECYSFPTLEERRSFNISGMGVFNYITEKTHHYVCRYQVLVRRHSSKQWISLGSFEGNKDRLTEVLHAFPELVLARYIRIVPESYNGSPSMQIALYNNTTDMSSSESAKTINCKLLLPSKKRYYMRYDSMKNCGLGYDETHGRKRLLNRSKFSTLVKSRDLGEYDDLTYDENDYYEGDYSDY
jgi:hypothetical protein